MAQATIRLFLVLSTLTRFGTSFIMATYVMFLLAHGLNLFEVNLVNFAFFATLAICEIPTGAIADVFGRKASFVASCFLYAFGTLLYACAGSFWGFVVAEITAAVASTFASGAFQAWLVDRLKHFGHSGSLHGVFAREQYLGSGFGIAGAFAGAFLAERNIAFPWIASSVVLACAGIVAAMRMKEEYFTRTTGSIREHIGRTVEKVSVSFRYGVRHDVVRFIFFMGTLQFFAIQAPNMQWQPFFSQFFSRKAELGFVWMGTAVSIMVGAKLAPRFLAFVRSERRSLIGVQYVIGMGILATVLCGSFAPALAAFFCHEAARGAFRPIKDAYLNDHIPSAERATLISFESLSHHLGGMFGLLASGFLAERCSMNCAWIASGAVLIVSSALLAKKGKTP